MKGIRTLAKGITTENKTMIGNVVFDDTTNICSIDGRKIKLDTLGLSCGQTDMHDNILFEFDIIQYNGHQKFIIVWSQTDSQYKMADVCGWSFSIDTEIVNNSSYIGNINDLEHVGYKKYILEKYYKLK